MAVQVAVNPRRRWNGSSAWPVRHARLIDGAATFVQGQFLRLATDGLLYEGTTGAASGVGDDKVDFIAGETVAAVLTVDTVKKFVFAVHRDDVYEINELDGTVSDANIGQPYDMDVTTNLCTLNVGSQSHAIFEVVEPKFNLEPYFNASADTLANTYVSLLASMLNAARTN